MQWWAETAQSSTVRFRILGNAAARLWIVMPWAMHRSCFFRRLRTSSSCCGIMDCSSSWAICVIIDCMHWWFLKATIGKWQMASPWAFTFLLIFCSMIFMRSFGNARRAFALLLLAGLILCLWRQNAGAEGGRCVASLTHDSLTMGTLHIKCTKLFLNDHTITHCGWHCDIGTNCTYIKFPITMISDHDSDVNSYDDFAQIKGVVFACSNMFSMDARRIIHDSLQSKALASVPSQRQAPLEPRCMWVRQLSTAKSKKKDWNQNV